MRVCSKCGGGRGKAKEEGGNGNGRKKGGETKQQTLHSTAIFIYTMNRSDDNEMLKVDLLRAVHGVGGVERGWSGISVKMRHHCKYSSGPVVQVAYQTT